MEKARFFTIALYLGDLQQYIPYGDRVEIVTLERFIMKANMGKL
ncbi:MAG: hypothetical protein ACK5RE_15775 [Pseudanabaena sp.]